MHCLLNMNKPHSKNLCLDFWVFLQNEMTYFLTVSFTSTSEIRTLAYTWSLKKVPLSGGVLALMDCARKSTITCYYQCSCITKILLILVLVFVYYAHFGKKCRNYAYTFHFKPGKNTSTSTQQTSWCQTHLPCLQLESLRVHCLTNLKQ